MFVSSAYDPALAKPIGVPVAGLDDCLIRCHEVLPCEAVIMGSQLDSHGNNYYLYQKREANLTVIWWNNSENIFDNDILYIYVYNYIYMLLGVRNVWVAQMVPLSPCIWRCVLKHPASEDISCLKKFEWRV